VIFVTVGTHTVGFDRLVEAMDKYAAKTGERVIMQIGNSTYCPEHCEWFRFAPYEQMQSHSMEATVVVCHAATSILTAWQQGTPVVAVPREQRFGEVIDDHQVEFAEALVEQGKIVAVRDVTCLAAVLSGPLPQPQRFGPSSLERTLRSILGTMG
jgi:UDP-N-acetylglucosamine transferase subunit ALG13